MSPGRTRAGAALFLGRAGLAAFVVALASLHVVRPDLDLVRTLVSEYARGPHGWLMGVAFAALGLGSAAVAVRLGADLRRRPTVRDVALWTWAAGTLVAGLFPTDEGGIPTSATGNVHSLAAGLAIVALPVAAVLTARSAAREAHGPGTGSARLRAVLVAATAAAFLASSQSAVAGIVERLFVAAAVWWLWAAADHPHLGDRRAHRRQVP